MLRLSELYTSVQGEGPRVGLMTQFVRFAGCNMRCPGWPCDTEFAIDPAIYRKPGMSQMLDPDELALMIVEEAERTGATNICFTGGEPFMQKEVELLDLVNYILLGNTTYTFEAFTNGSFRFPEWTKQPQVNMLFTMDWKLEGSGEGDTKVPQRMENAKFLKRTDGIKFVVKDHADLDEAVIITEQLHAKKVQAQLWVGRAWDTLTDLEIIEFIKEFQLPWRLNVQMHKLLWDPSERRV